MWRCHAGQDRCSYWSIPKWSFPSWKHCSIGHRMIDALHSSDKEMASGALDNAYLICPFSRRRKKSHTQSSSQGHPLEKDKHEGAPPWPRSALSPLHPKQQAIQFKGSTDCAISFTDFRLRILFMSIVRRSFFSIRQEKYHSLKFVMKHFFVRTNIRKIIHSF